MPGIMAYVRFMPILVRTMGRVRLGIGHPGHKDAVANYVLHDFAKADADWLAALLVGLSDGAPALASGVIVKKFMTLGGPSDPPAAFWHGGWGVPRGERAQDAPCPRPAAASPTAKLEVAPAQTALQALLQKFRS